MHHTMKDLQSYNIFNSRECFGDLGKLGSRPLLLYNPSLLYHDVKQVGTNLKSLERPDPQPEANRSTNRREQLT